MTTAPPTYAELQAHANRVYPAIALLAGMQLDVFTPLADGPLEAAELAEKLGLPPARLARLLYALAAGGFLSVEGGRFANGPLADHLLVRGRPAYMGGVHALWADLWSATLQTSESVRTDKPQALHDFAKMSQDELRTFFRGLHGGAVAAGGALAEALGFARHRHLLDVGGGSGGVAIGACEAVPGLRATVTDLPAVAEITRGFVSAAGMDERIAVKPADLTAESIAGPFDVAVLRHLLQTLSADAARRVLANLGGAIEPGGRVHIIGFILEDSRLAPAEALNFDIVFLNIYDEGACYTIGEHAEWLRAAGFTDVEHRPAPAGSAPPGNMLLSARKR